MSHSLTTLPKEKNNLFLLKNSFNLIAVPHLCESWEIQTTPAYCLMALKGDSNMSLLNYGPYVPSRHTRLRALRAFVPYPPSCLTRLRAFAPYVPYSRTLSARLARMICAP